MGKERSNEEFSKRKLGAEADGGGGGGEEKREKGKTHFFVTTKSGWVLWQSIYDEHSTDHTGKYSGDTCDCFHGS
jgi:hypothetical protein